MPGLQCQISFPSLKARFLKIIYLFFYFKNTWQFRSRNLAETPLFLPFSEWYYYAQAEVSCTKTWEYCVLNPSFSLFHRAGNAPIGPSAHTLLLGLMFHTFSHGNGDQINDLFYCWYILAVLTIHLNVFLWTFWTVILQLVTFHTCVYMFFAVFEYIYISFNPLI